MKRIETKSYAKINWTLRVGPRREDGFHVLETIFQTISLAAYPVWYVNLLVSIGAFFVVAFSLDKFREWKRKRALRAEVSVGESSDNGVENNNKTDGKVVDVRVGV